MSSNTSRLVILFVELLCSGVYAYYLLRIKRFRYSANRVASARHKLEIIVLSSTLLIMGFSFADFLTHIGPLLVHATGLIMDKLGVRGTQILIGMVVVVLGSGAFFFKLKYQTVYGLVEVLFAWVAGVITARQITPGRDWSGQLAALIGAIYIVSRGLSNVKDGIAKRKEMA